jgi:hypothetical protein
MAQVLHSGVIARQALGCGKIFCHRMVSLAVCQAIWLALDWVLGNFNGFSS